MQMDDVVIFGTGGFASLVWYCLTHDSPFRVRAFTVDADFLREPEFMGLPVVAFEELERFYPPPAAKLIIPLGYHSINAIRRARYESAKCRGYGFANYVSSRASVWPDLRIGENSLIFEHAVVQPFVSIGSNSIICCCACIAHHCKLEAHVFVAGGAALSGNICVGEQAFIGTGAVLRDGLSVAARSFIGAGAVVAADTASDAVYVGNPARSIGQAAKDAL